MPLQYSSSAFDMKRNIWIAEMYSTILISAFEKALIMISQASQSHNYRGMLGISCQMLKVGMKGTTMWSNDHIPKIREDTFLLFTHIRIFEDLVRRSQDVNKKNWVRCFLLTHHQFKIREKGILKNASIKKTFWSFYFE